MPAKDSTEFVEELRDMLPVAAEEMDLDKDIPAPERAELVIVDVVRGFTREGAMAAPELMEPMVEAINTLAMKLIRRLGGRLHVTMFQDYHSPDIPEPPYPKHCTWDTEEPKIDPDLGWLESMNFTDKIQKDCINGLVGAINIRRDDDYSIPFLEDLKRRAPRKIIVVGDCTDICVSDFVTSMLSARNHGLLTNYTCEAKIKAEAIIGMDICVFEPGCATYHFDQGKPEPGRHPEDVAHHVGLWTMASRGARILKAIR
jgi:nicotinamidase-related amidase